VIDFDLEHNVIASATELFGFALKETSTESQHRAAVDQIINDVLDRYPEISAVTLAFAMGRALGKFEADRGGKAVKEDKRR
jgi:hypothetical protein